MLFALLIYCKVDTEKKIAEFKKLPSSDHKEMQMILESELAQKPKFKLADIEQELTSNKKLIEMTAGNEDGDADEGSDSEPSEDNLDEEDLAQIVPLPKKNPEPENVKINTVKQKKTEPIKVEKEEQKAVSA